MPEGKNRDFPRLPDCATICITPSMSESANSSVPSSPLALGKWLGLVVSAVVLAEGVWTTLVSLTKDLLLPLMAITIGGDAHSPLGKGELNIPDLFVSLVELCLAGIVFLSIKIWVTRGAPRPPRVRRATSRVRTEQPAVVPQAEAVAAQVEPAPVAPPASPPVPQMRLDQAEVRRDEEVPLPPPVISQAPPAPEPSPVPNPAPASAKPKKPGKAKPQKPKEVYYNIVGEPITPEDE
jgi:hypothetical protein